MKQIPYIAAQVFLLAPLLVGALFGKNDFLENHSEKRLRNVPHNLPSQTTILYLSENSISTLLQSDFSYLSKLNFLNISHNLITELDFSIFSFNSDLQYLDVSHNSLRSVSCDSLHHAGHLKHLDLSYNRFATLSSCREFSFLLDMKYLGLSALEIHHSDFEEIKELELETLFLGLEDLSVYEKRSLQVLNANKLHIAVPTSTQGHSLLLDAFNASRTLELSNIQCEAPCDYPTESLSQISKSSRIKTLIFHNITLSFADITIILQSVLCSCVQYLNIYRMTVVYELPYFKFDFSRSFLKELTIKHLINKVTLYHGIHPVRMFSEMVVENFTLSDSDLVYFYCPPETNRFHLLDVSENRITDDTFQNCTTLSHLEILHLQSNMLEDLSKVSAMTVAMRSLKYLDVSKNFLQYEKSKECFWSETLVILNVSSNELADSVFECLPANIQILDLQKNQITSIPKVLKSLTFLEELNVASNRLTDLPDCSNFGSLAILNVEMNSILSPSSDSSHKCRNVTKIDARNNPFLCNCDIREFISQVKASPERLIGWPKSYRCEYPEDMRRTLLNNFNLSELSCNTTILLVFVLTTTVVFVLCIYFLCIYFNLPWYVRMLWQWIRTKYRVRNMTTQDLQRDLLFHAFVSYSEHDSGWVKNSLLPKLQKEDGSIRICQHERNFVPGKGIVENIINSIEKSYKSIFVLSPNFVKSEWCHYELYFAHHRLFCESSNSLILILLEPIPPYLIPKRYHKLKALMARRTYLEWPKDISKHGLFWANLREAIQVNLPPCEQELDNLLHTSQTYEENYI
ncbi:toll-like receptor 1 [Ambystoma mexicanum]|uniref:toll-like receptor 1 n=1 Tax=Ambystoma mexicanum TaxID=8296 RepID=UPI0037E97E6B